LEGKTSKGDTGTKSGFDSKAAGHRWPRNTMTKTKALCGATFKDNVCTKATEHHGKHLDDRNRWAAWTDQGKAQALADEGITAAATDVLAENITITEGGHQTLDIEFDFLCHCGRRHWAREEFCHGLIQGVNAQLECGRVSLRFPWTTTPGRDEESIYGQ
jgi:hypothetical protein